MLTSSQVYKGKYLEVLTLPVGQMQANCYLVVDKKSSSCLIIDPGDDAEYIENIISDKKLKPIKIICTHGHFDHVGAVLILKLAYQIPFLINKKDEFLFKKARNSASHFVGIDIGPAVKIDDFLKEDELVNIDNIKLKVIESPGHTPGSICLYLKAESLIFTGDLVFSGGMVGRVDFSYSSSSDLQKSLQKIYKLPKETLIFPGHGEVFRLSAAV
ncbi:MBL fold metallo-hydrolase [Candidatus Gottesmanbacteria bacterium]|nr:MBL fold metallo-hydrolase [Candidatus Gottesmanbacteria bacterium]